MEILVNLTAIVVVVLLFNFMIFFHELGHFLAAKWRGLEVEKFYIWFGKPIWKKTFGGVEYGIGSIPAGGFVALPQMAPMEAIEGGDSERRKELPPISPLDKIIVAFAGPLFSFLLAFAAACAVWIFGKPADTVHSTTIGYIEKDSPAERAGLQLGDKIVAVDGEQVSRFFGGLDGVQEKIMLSKNKSVDLTYERDGVEQVATSEFLVDETSWFQRRAMRRVGISYAGPMIINDIEKESPAERAGLQAGDVVKTFNGISLHSVPQLSDLLKGEVGKQVELVVDREGTTQTFQVDAIIPNDKLTGKPEPDGRALIGARFDTSIDLSLVNPSPAEQVKEGLLLMLTTVQAITAKNSNVGIQHLSGPVGIGHAMFGFIRTDEALRRILWFMVVLNINLAIMNMMPLPVLDGGHIVLALGEWIAGKPVKLRVLEVIQTGFVLVLFSLFIYITTKDLGALVPGGKKEQPWGRGGYVWPLNEAAEPALQPAGEALGVE